MRRRMSLIVLLVCAIVLPWSARADSTASILVPPYSLSIVNVIVRPNDRQTNCAKGLFLKGGLVLTAYHVGESRGNNTRYLSPNSLEPTCSLMDLMGDKASDFSILSVPRPEDAQRYREYSGGFGSDDLVAGDIVYYFKTYPNGPAVHEIIQQRVAEVRNAAGRIFITGGVAGGYSGSPVFSLKSHRFVGMIVFGDPTMTELQPFEDIIGKVRKVNPALANKIDPPAPAARVRPTPTPRPTRTDTPAY